MGASTMSAGGVNVATWLAFGLAFVGWFLSGGTTQVVAAAAAAGDFAAARPLLARYCLECHSGDAAEGEVDLSFTHDAATLGKHAKLLQRVEDMVTSGQMPPPESDQPTEEERRVVADWLRAFLAGEARAHAGDPCFSALLDLHAAVAHDLRVGGGGGVGKPRAVFSKDRFVTFWS